MKLKILLSDKGPSIIKKWRDVILETYPDDTQRFLRKEKDQFSNPVGNIIGKDIEALYNELISEGDTDKILSCLENIIRIRAVQDFKPSQAIAFVIQLKDIIRQELGGKSPMNYRNLKTESMILRFWPLMFIHNAAKKSMKCGSMMSKIK